jgi:chromosome segregation ATPase
MKDPEKDQLKRLVKACMLEISKLKMDLKKCSETNQDCKKVTQLQLEIEEKEEIIAGLEGFLNEKDETINNLKNELNDKNNHIKDLEEIKTYFEALTAKPKRDLTSFQSQVYLLLPSEKSNTHKMHNFIKKVGFTELSYDNMFSILRNLERKGYFKSHKVNEEILWEKIQK